MKTIITFLGLLIGSSSFGQYMFPDKIKGCNMNQFFLENDSISTNYKSTQDLILDIYNNLNPKYKDNLRGVLTLQLYIDTNGKVCLLSVNNESNVKTSKLDISDAVNNLDNWTVPMRKNKPTEVCAILKLTFNKKTIKAERLGFNYRTKYKTLMITTVDK
jgi:hypothetical protein